MLIGSKEQQSRQKTVKKLMMIFKNIFPLLCSFLLLEACSRKIYRPPALGAEYQFDRGLPPAKHKSRLFDKGMQEYLEKRGIKSPSQKGKVSSSSSAQASSATDSSAVQDSSQKNIPSTTLHSGNEVSSDSSHNVRH